MKQTTMIIDLQYGSVGKGLIAGKYALENGPDTIMSSFAPNAGHSLIDCHGNKFVHTMLPNGTVSTSVRQVLIGPGAIIDPDALWREYQAMVEYRGEFELIIHPHATVVTQEHRDLEAGPMTKIGSTKKGVGEALIQKIRRDPDNQNVAKISLIDHQLAPHVAFASEYDNAVDLAQHILIESAQGFGLSLHHGFYPYTTSRDVTPMQIAADVGLPFHRARTIDVIGCLRTFPIRVANRFDKEGNQIGWSGPHYPDQREMDWSELGRVPELTTVTKLPRRIFTFSNQQAVDAIRMTGASELFLNFANYLNSGEEVEDFIHEIDRLAAFNLGYVRWVGFGPAVNDVLDLEEYGRHSWPKVLCKAFDSAKARGL